MTYALTADQVNQYQRDGFLFPLDVFDKGRVADILYELEQARAVACEKGLESELAQLLRANTHYLMPFVSEVARSPQLLDRVESILGLNRSAQDRIGLVFRFITPEVKQLVAKCDYAMMVRGIDEGKNWIHVSPPTRLFDPTDLKLHVRIRQDQAAALAEGTEQELYTSY